eukprot:TRINITY_DN5916_c0_g1_i2.p1 TRINITY_DN5916_c0_g1~~TRINITY_DN5916_c0_g1_i2.p1  ORF type:complete len:356 (+),score=44.11 TRINITY_DN5916_c0_g1_i2:127-1068(+)
MPQKTFQKLKQKAENLEKNVKGRLENVQNAIRSETFVKTKDKLAFFLGVMNTVITPFLVESHPEYFALFYTFKAILLIGARAVIYKKMNWHYFLFDFCYFANFLMLSFLWVLPDYPTLFLICFCISNGPLSWAVPLWRNSMVFHSVDKITSIFIHLSPPILSYVLRWKSDLYPQYSICENPECDVPYINFIWIPLIPYVIWQMMYYVKVDILSSHKERMTSAKWLLNSQKGLIYNVSTKPFGKEKATFGFMFVQLIFTIVTFLPMKLLWHYRGLHFAFVGIIGMISIWNGANYYFDGFRLFSLTASIRSKIYH